MKSRRKEVCRGQIARSHESYDEVWILFSVGNHCRVSGRRMAWLSMLFSLPAVQRWIARDLETEGEEVARRLLQWRRQERPLACTDMVAMGIERRGQTPDMLWRYNQWDLVRERQMGSREASTTCLQGEEATGASRSCMLSSAMYFNPNVNPNNTVRDTVLPRFCVLGPWGSEKLSN